MVTFTVLVGASLSAADGSRLVHIAPLPPEEERNEAFDLQVAVGDGPWQAIPCQRVRVSAYVNGHYEVRFSSMATVEVGGAARFRLRHRGLRPTQVQIRPLSRGLHAQLDGETLEFAVPRPMNLSVELDGDRFDNLQLFVNPLQAPPLAGEGERLIVVGPGLHEARSILGAGTGSAHRGSEPEGGVLLLPSHSLLYLAPGAVLRGQVRCEGVEAVRICGRGQVEQGGRGSGIQIVNAQHVEVRDVFTPSCFTGGSEDVHIAGVRCISYLPNGDGMNVISSRRVLIEGVFNRNSDDCMTVYGSRGKFVGGCSEVTLRDATLWADLAHPILVGTHGNPDQPDTLEDLRFQNIDILDHQEPQLDYQGCLSLNAGDNNLIRRVLFEDIRVEDFRRGQLLNLRVFFNKKYCRAPGRGIEQVVFRRLSYQGTHAELSIIAGYDESRVIKDLVFEDLSINGVLIYDGMPKLGWFRTGDLARIFVGEHVEGVRFLRSSP